ncbi:MAG: argininosuccinate lyase [Clostridiales bacterium]|nr:argininosuccinate lyase [Clostridiales bacterium]
MNLWAGRFDKPLSADADAFNESLSFDKKLYRADITASIAHATMLGKCSIIGEDEANTIVKGLNGILNDIEEHKLEIVGAEDIHSFVENELVKRIGQVGKKLHTARSRNDQVATDMRIYVRESTKKAKALLVELLNTLYNLAYRSINFVMPGFTHLRKAQPINCAQYFNAYSEMFLRDLERFDESEKRVNVMPLGSAALAGTSYPIDREITKNLLGFAEISQNSLDAVSDRDFIAEYIFCASLTMAHLSRLCEDTILYTSDEFGFWVIPDEYSTGSSIMPQKKNPDLPELVRGKTGRVYGHLMGILTMMKGLPLAYNKDYQEDKEAFFDAENTLFSCLAIYTALLNNIKLNQNAMFDAAGKGFSTATDIADYLAKKGVPFRDAHAITGKIVRYCITEKKDFLSLTLDEFKAVSDVFEKDILGCITVRSSAEARNSVGGSSLKAARAGLASIRRRLKKY